MSLSTIWYEVFSNVDTIREAIQNNGNIYIAGKDLEKYNDPTVKTITLALIMQVNVKATINEETRGIEEPEDVDPDRFVDMSECGIFSDKVCILSGKRNKPFGAVASRRLHVYPFKYYRYFDCEEFIVQNEYIIDNPVPFILHNLSSIFEESIGWNSSFAEFMHTGLTLFYICLADNVEDIGKLNLQVSMLEAASKKFKLYTKRIGYSYEGDITGQCSLPNICWKMLV